MSWTINSRQAPQGGPDFPFDMIARPELVFQNVDGLRSLGLEVPEPVALLYELRQAGVDVPLTALTVDECARVLKELLAQDPIS